MTTQTDEQALAIVRRHYPEAVTTTQAVNDTLAYLRRSCALTADRVLLADSICSDDVNSIEYPETARAMLGPFKLGGLDGFPHAGVTGMGAFAAHAPDGGAILIYHAPHIGVSRDGALGLIVRPGQDKQSGCCGAARAALGKLQAGTLTVAAPSEFDHQQGTIEQIFLRASQRILSAESPLKEATEVMYEAIAERIDLLVQRTTFPTRYVVLSGGILINGDADMGSFNAMRRLVRIDQQSGEVLDLSDVISRAA
ncbi:MAG TPA: hypothetical protein VE861_04840 [Gemmatimonadaceae bacterium]|nr:hypothetical protein [Gemmatimonadaceae bacterium]